MNEREVLVSVCIITYNHEDYISQAIEGVLLQKCNFPLELVIGEDCSSDQTRQICEQYAAKYPRINLLPSELKFGMMPNFVRSLQTCTGKYIALCEGDDYWTDPYKLQKQVNFLEANPDVSLCFHNADVCYENNNRPSHQFFEIRKGYYTGKQIIENWTIPTASVVFRNVKIDWPKFYNTAVHGDILLFLLLAEKGELYGFEESWCTYRKNSCSITNSNYLNVTYNRKVIAQLNNMNTYFHKKYNDVFTSQLIYWEYGLLAALYKNMKYHIFLIEILKFAIDHPGSLLKKLKARYKSYES